MDTPAHITRNRLVGGDLAIDFVNTQAGPPDGPPEGDALLTFDDLAYWAGYVQLIDEADVVRLLVLARERPAEAAAMHARALATRAYLFHLFRAVGRAEPLQETDLAKLRDDESDAIAHGRLVHAESSLEWAWDDDDLGRPLWPVIHAAVDLLTGPRVGRIKQCGGCRFLFVDLSKNGSRRWCAMEDCGTVEKGRAYVARRRARRQAPSNDGSP